MRAPRRPRWATRFDHESADPLQSLTQLADVMLVFACGLIAALAANPGGLPPVGESPQSRLGGPPAPEVGRSSPEVTRGKELPEVPKRAGQSGSGYEPVGRVYRDESSGKLILIGD